MGGTLKDKGKVPVFLISALKDPDGANLDRARMVKGWVDASGELHERVYRSEEHTSELQSLMRISYAVFCLKKQIKANQTTDPQLYHTHHLIQEIVHQPH